ncbi:MAG TPA: type I DNA topoisomerase [Candidatus Saccharibacteria bacterium]|nr:type I DNA topoisomerase [Candidatus Saccharibacteria bacterium]
MSRNLVIVESPAKAKTIEGYLGKDFKVLSSIGHIRSIAKKTKDGTPPIDTRNGFETVYEIDSDKKKTITELKKAVKAADTVWLATDEDREGEAIAWHLCEVLKLDPKKTKRIVFHEITKSAIEEAVKNPRTVDMSLVRAQQARQILDRLVGFELSPVVWQKVPGGKSAGRVQSPAVRLLVEREREIRSFDSQFDFKVTGLFEHDGETIKAELSERFATENEARAFLEQLQQSSFLVNTVSKSPGTRNPAAPFTTSTLQQTANSQLGFSSKATMQAAQKLYQEGKITYMRTDSVNLSKQAMAAAAGYIEQAFGREYVKVRAYKTKGASAQEAHEAIRPTDMAKEVVSSNEYDQRLYDLIRRRTLASQMAPAQLERTEVTISIQPPATSKPEKEFVAKGEVITFDGFLRVYGRSKEDSIVPPLTNGDALVLTEALARQTFSRPPARYTEGSLVKKLEELGIGRPSTYATIISTIQTRGYVERGIGEGTEREVIELQLTSDKISKEVVTEKTGADKGKLVPTPAGELIADFLTNHFDEIVDYSFTANVEKEFDEIAAEKLDRNAMLQSFYEPFHKRIKTSGDIDRASVAQAREVGIDPRSGKPIFARFGRFGPLLQLGSTEAEEKPEFAPLPKGARVETVTLEQALKAFELPRVVGTTEDGQEIKANVGRFGPYIQVGKLYVSIKKPLDPHTITESEARDLYTLKLQAEAEKNIADFGDGVKILNGRYGPYITDGKKNAKIPKGTDPKTITHDEAKKLLAEAPAKTAKRRFTRKKK